MSTRDFLCKICMTNRSFNKFPDYFRHITLYHANEPDFQLTCDISNSCGVMYKTFTSYKMHIHRHHKFLLNPPIQQQENNIINDIDKLSIQQLDSAAVHPATTDSDHDDVIYTDFDNDDLDNQWQIPTSNVSRENEKISLITVQQQYTRFLLEMREQHILPQRIIQSITTHIVNLLDM
jgi:uncharacterized C2H2 Zn-finger protein